MESNEINKPYLMGKRIYLREVTVQDVSNRYLEWMNNPKIKQYIESKDNNTTIEALVQYVEEKNADKNSIFLAIVLNGNKSHIGNIKLGPIDWYHGLADIGIIIGETECWGQGYATEAIQLVTNYAFDELRLHKLTAGCYEDNISSARAFEKADFILEGIRPEHLYHDGKYQALCLYGRINPKSGTPNE